MYRTRIQLLVLVTLVFAVSTFIYAVNRSSAASSFVALDAGMNTSEPIASDIQNMGDHPITERQNRDSHVEEPISETKEASTERFSDLLKGKQNWRRSYSDEDQKNLSTLSIAQMVTTALDGNLFLARQLSLLQQSCENAPQTANELAADIDYYQQTRVDGSIDLAGTGLTEAEWTQSRIRTMQSQFTQCTEFRNAIAQSGDTDLLHLAADGGYSIALFDMGMQSRSTNSDVAYVYFEQAWQSGYPDALRRMSEIEQVRHEAGESDRGSFEATAMFIAFVTVYEQLVARAGLDSKNSPMPGLYDQADEMVGKLLPHQRNAMYKRASEIIEQNRECCFTL